MCHFIRKIPGGVEFRTRFWMGYTLIRGKPVCMLPGVYNELGGKFVV